MPNILSVKQLNLYARSLLEGDSRLSFVSVKGEVSNFKNHYSSGHLYFSLKDADALIRCVMFKGSAATLKFLPKDGQEVICSGRVSIYERDGQYQMYVENMSPIGAGNLAEQFRLTKEKLEKEGLFDSTTKRALPVFPHRLAVVTSQTGAALQDIINIISRRYPLCEVVLSPAAVQGDNAPASLISALERAYKSSDADIIIIGRGGGSAEDLSAFNDEALARKIYESPIPVISAVGHETDFSISDFVADLRAPTPSAAAELAVPDILEIENVLSRREITLKTLLNARYENACLKFEKAVKNPFISNFTENVIARRSEQLDRAEDRLKALSEAGIRAAESRFIKAAATLDGISPLKTLSRGYAVVSKSGKAICGVKDISESDFLEVKFTDGCVDCEVKSVNRRKNYE